MKKCSNCGEIKPLSEFYKTSYSCKICVRRRSKEWASNNPERAKELKMRYGHTDKGKKKAKEIRTNNIERYRANVRFWASNNQEYFRKREKVHTDVVSDKYVRKQLRRGGVENPTAEQIEQRRKLIFERRAERIAKKDERYFCKECGVIISLEIGDRRKAFCSVVCRKKHWQRGRNQRRRMKILKSFVDDVDSTKVFERDNYICQICGCQTSIVFRGSYLLFAPELDHIIPLARGGEHSYRNTQCTCRACNQLKGSKIYAKSERTQTRYREILLELWPAN